jgi:preprotein translocase subunit SecA
LFNLQVEVEQDEQPADELEAEGTFTESDRIGAPVLDPATPQIDFAQAQAKAEPAPQIRAKGLERKAKPTNLAYSAPSEDGDAEVVVAPADEDPFAGTGRNADCPCGSGKKYKKCHGAPGGASGRATLGG